MNKLYAKREASGSFHPHHDFEGKNKLKLCHPEELTCLRQVKGAMNG
jgi:hypothetical protein